MSCLNIGCKNECSGGNTFTCSNATCILLVNTYVNSERRVGRMIEIYMEKKRSKIIKKMIRDHWTTFSKMNKRNRVNMRRQSMIKEVKREQLVGK